MSHVSFQHSGLSVHPKVSSVSRLTLAQNHFPLRERSTGPLRPGASRSVGLLGVLSWESSCLRPPEMLLLPPAGSFPSSPSLAGVWGVQMLQAFHLHVQLLNHILLFKGHQVQFVLYSQNYD